jgi:hypothetical protein
MAIRLSTGLVNGLAVTDCLKNLLEGTSNAGFFIDIYTGTRPASPDAAATGTKLARITAAAGARLHLEAAVTSAGRIDIEADEAWSAVGLANGTAGYYRLVTNSDDGTTLSTTAVRIDGTVATSGGDATMTSTTVATGAPFTISTGYFSLPTA